MAHDALLTTLCTLRDVAFALMHDDLRIRYIGGVPTPWPGLEVGGSLLDVLPELAESEAEMRAALARGERFVRSWVMRPGRERPLYYQLVIHVHPTDPAQWVCWMIDRTAYGRLKARIDQYYRELMDQEANTEPDSPLDPDITR